VTIRISRTPLLHERITLKYILKKYGERVWIRLNWLTTGNGGRLL
jgi:hypothetical protein